ncbi:MULTISPECIES: IS3 family transposase [Bacteroides]|uniref:IS3 family transposase n=1 Tax=Bacteroides fragilis TaxID=817 RepID=A0AAP9NHB0_BACFG|nr:IS3 family transposase [Bacteroides fragilis]QKH87386.1 IS3 family transposase [Bacteroides fragilis]
MDYRIDNCRSRDEVRTVLENYMECYNKQRPCFAIGYDIPVGYRKRYYKGELDRKDTFSKRKLPELPKFVQNRKNSADNQKIE